MADCLEFDRIFRRRNSVLFRYAHVHVPTLYLVHDLRPARQTDLAAERFAIDHLALHRKVSITGVRNGREGRRSCFRICTAQDAEDRNMIQRKRTSFHLN